MTPILQYLATDGEFLFEHDGFRIVDSHFTRGMGKTGYVTLQAGEVQITFIIDRGEWEILVGPATRNEFERSKMFSMDIVKRLLSGTIDDQVAMYPANAEFLRAHHSEIVDAFSPANAKHTVKLCDGFKQERTKRLFG